MERSKLETIQVYDPNASEDLFTYGPREIVEKILLYMNFKEFTRVCGVNKRIREICLNIRKRYYERHKEEIIREMEKRPDIELYRMWIDLAKLDSIHQKLSEGFIAYNDLVNHPNHTNIGH